MEYKHNKSGMSLMELVVSMILLALIVLFVGTLNATIRRRFENENNVASLNNQVSFAISHIMKNLSEGAGNFNQPAICTTGAGAGCVFGSGTSAIIFVRRNDNTWFSYNFNAGNNTIEYDEDVSVGAGLLPITNRNIVNLSFNFMPSLPPDDPLPSPPNVPNRIDIAITAQPNPLAVIDPITNPQVIVTSSVVLGSMSIH